MSRPDPARHDVEPIPDDTTEVSQRRTERANGPRRSYWPSAWCPRRRQPVDPSQTNVGCALYEECGAWRSPGRGPFCDLHWASLYDPRHVDLRDQVQGDLNLPEAPF